MFIRRHSHQTKARPRFHVRRLVASDIPRVQELIVTGLLDMIPDGVANVFTMWRVRAALATSILLVGWACARLLRPWMYWYVSAPLAAVACYAAALALIRHILTRSLWAYINHSMTEDLADMLSYYQGPGDAPSPSPDSSFSGVEAADFWVCEVMELGKDEPWVVGCIGLDVQSRTFPGCFELRRLSVEASYRQFGVGRRLMEALEARVRELGEHRVWLETSHHQIPALETYKRMGWVVVRSQRKFWFLDIVQMCRVVPS